MADTRSHVSLDPQAPPFLSNPSEDLRSGLTKDLEGFLKGDPQALTNIVDLNLYYLKMIHPYEAKIARLECDTHPVQAQIRNRERELILANHENRLLKQQIALVEDASKILSLRIAGLHKRSGENLVTYVASTLSRTGVSCSYEDIDYAKRIGKYKPGSTCPILVKFIRESKRNLILYNRANLNCNANTLVWINDDVSNFTRRQRKTVRDIAAYAKSQGTTDLKIHGDGLVLGNGKYKHQDLDLLPAHLSISKAKQIADDSDLYFQSEYSPLSNFYPCTIYDENDVYFNCAEQLFQHKKAIHHNFLFTADKIMLTRDPYELKRLGNQLPTSQTWLQEEEAIMTDILRDKFTQNGDLAGVLIATGNLHLHEATADSKWSTGAELSSKAVINGIWQGSDVMGSLLEVIRSELREGTDTPPQHSQPPPLEGDDDDILPMPDEGEEDEVNNTPAPPPHAQSPRPHQQSPTHPNNSHSMQTLTLTHLNKLQPVTPNSPATTTPTTTPSQQPSLDSTAKILPLMQCQTTEPTPTNISARAPTAKNLQPATINQPNNKPYLIPKARELRTDSKRALRNARADYIKQKINTTSDDPKKFWMEINSLSKNSSSKSNIELCDSNEIPVPSKNIPDHINSFFATIGPKLAEKFNRTENDPPITPLPAQATYRQTTI